MKMITLGLFLLISFAAISQAPTIDPFPANNVNAPGFSGATGTTMTINGTNLTGATAVSFGGVPAASFTVLSSTKITAVVGAGNSGSLSVTTPNGTVSRAGFTYLPLSRIITDFGGYWSSTTASNNSTVIDSSHNLLGFTYNGTFYSTGVSDSTLTSRGVAFTPGSYRAFPVSGIAGTSSSSGSVYLAVASKADGNPSAGNVAGVASSTIRSVLIDGIRGLDLGTGITNLPTSAVLTFNLSNIDISKISDAEPDIIITQIADPSAGNDRFEFLNAGGTTVGTFLTQDMTVLSSFGTYKLDLFTLTPNVSYNTATPSGVNSSNGTKGIRLVGLKLSDFGITAANAATIKSMKITPSGNSDYAFIAYNTKIISAAPNISQNTAASSTNVCSNTSAVLNVIGTASGGGALTYYWERSTDGGTTWSMVSNGSSYSGATSTTLTISSPVNNDRYRATVSEAGGTSNTSDVFILTVYQPSVGGNISGSATVCATSNSTTLTLSGYTGSVTKWQYSTNNFSTSTDVANTTATLTATNLTATTKYRAVIQNGTCSIANSAVATITVNARPTSVISGSATICNGSTTAVSIALTGTSPWNLTYTDGTTPVSVNNITSSPYTFTTGTAGTYTVSVLSDANCTALAANKTGSAVVTVNANSAGGSIAGGASVCTGSNSTTLTLSGYTGSVIKWQSSTDNFSTVADIANTSSSLSATNLTANTSYRAVVQSGVCAAVNSATATITVNAAPVGGAISGGTTVCTGTNSTQLTLSGYTGSIVKWQSSTNDFGTASDIANTTASYTATNLTAATKYRAVLQSGVCNTAYSTAAAVAINNTGEWIGGASGNWNNAANWCGGVPTTPSNVSIPSGSTVTITSGTSVANSVSIAPGGSLVLSGDANLQITAGGYITNNGTFNTSGSTTGKVIFAGSATVSGTITFSNVEANGAVDFGTASTINGQLLLNANSSLTGHSPYYACPGSSLVYKSGSVYTRGLEWTTASSGAGYPSNVLVQNNTTVNFPVAGAGFVCNDVIVDPGSALNQNYGGGSAPLTVTRDVTISGTLSLGASTGGDISLGRNWTRSSGGVFNHNNRSVTFEGSSNSTITAPTSSSKNTFGSFGGETFYRLVMSKSSAASSLALAAPVAVLKELKLTKGTFDLAGSDATLVSNAENTASIAALPTTGGVVNGVSINYSGAGRFVIQRHLDIGATSAARRWRLLTAPLSADGAPTINQAWQSGVSNSNRNTPVNPWPGFGTTITKSTTYNAADGYDQGSTNNASLYYPGTNNGIFAWGVLPSTHVPITNYEGYFLFARGSRDIVVSTPSINANPTVLEPKGKINTGSISKTITGGFQVLGNPYASAISLNNVTLSSFHCNNSIFNNTTPGAEIGVTYYIWDPKTSGGSNVGKLITCSSDGFGRYTVTENVSGLPDDGTIQSGSAFMINASSAGGTITFHESDKLTNSSAVGLASRPTGAETVASLSSTLMVGSGSSASVSEGVINSYHPAYHDAVDGQDAVAAASFNTTDGLRILSQGQLLSIERRSAVTSNDTIFLQLYNVSKKAYSLRFKPANMNTSLTALLQDDYKGTETPISMADTSSYAFDINADVRSGSADRFRIVFKALGVLPITFSSLQAVKQNNNIAVKWKVENELNVRDYEVERSANGRSFNKMNNTNATGNNHSSVSYNWLDVNTIKGDNYYRIKTNYLDGTSVYSKTIKVSIADVQMALAVYPNPVVNSQIGLQFSNVTAGDYKLTLSNGAGQAVERRTIKLNAGSSSESIVPASHLAAGTYNLEVLGPNGYKQVLKVMVQ